MSQRDKLQAGIDSLGYRIAATGQNLADEPSERNGGNGLAYARKLVIYGKALEVLRRELATLDNAASAPEEPTPSEIAEEVKRRGFTDGWGWR